jgi:hypothetical protein
MNRLRSPAAIFPSLLLAVAFCAARAAEPDVDKDLRGAERLQQGASASALRNADELRSLADSYRCNGLADAAMLDALVAIQRTLARLADPAQSASSTNMPAVLLSLAQARAATEPGTRRAELLAASRGQSVVLRDLQGLLALARAKLGGASAARALSAIAERQNKLREETERLSGETLGLSADDLNAEQRVDLCGLGDGQANLRDETVAALSDLDKHAADVSVFQAEAAQAIRQATAQLRQADAPGLMRQAAERIAANRLVQARDDQKRVLDLLAAALALINQDFPVPVFTGGSGAPASSGPGPGGGPIDGAFADVPPFELITDQPAQEYVPGFGRVPMVRSAGSAKARAWYVGLPEKERQVLESALEERFPDKYAELLKAYYRSLAGGEAP